MHWYLEVTSSSKHNDLNSQVLCYSRKDLKLWDDGTYRYSGIVCRCTKYGCTVKAFKILTINMDLLHFCF